MAEKTCDNERGDARGKEEGDKYRHRPANNSTPHGGGFGGAWGKLHLMSWPRRPVTMREGMQGGKRKVTSIGIARQTTTRLMGEATEGRGGSCT